MKLSAVFSSDGSDSRRLNTWMAGRVAVSLVLSGLVLWAGFCLYALTGDRYQQFYKPQPVDPFQWQMLEGDGGVGETGFELRMWGERSFALAATQLPRRLQAESVDRVELLFDPEGSFSELYFGWSQSATLSGYSTQMMSLDESGRALLEADELFGWTGEIEYFLVRVRGRMDPPVVLRGGWVHRARPGFIEFQRRLFGDWFDWRPWTQISINRALVAGGEVLVSPVAAVAAWLLTAMLILLAWRGRHGYGNLILPVVTLILVGWLLLDLRWQGELLSRVVEGRDQFAGKSWQEKRAADVDGDVFTFIEELKGRIDDPDVRFMIYAGSEFVHLRARYFAIPRVTHSEIWPPRRIFMRRVISGDQLILVDLPSVQEGEAPEPLEAETIDDDSASDFPLIFDLEEVTGRHASMVERDGRSWLELDDEGVLLVESRWMAPPPAGFYRLQARLEALGDPGWVMMQVRHIPDEGGQEVTAERDFFVSGKGLYELELPFVVTDADRVQYRLRTFDATGLRAAGFKLDVMPDSGQLTHIVVREPATSLVLRPVMESEAVRAFEIQ